MDWGCTYNLLSRTMQIHDIQDGLGLPATDPKLKVHRALRTLENIPLPSLQHHDQAKQRLPYQGRRRSN
jgi:hypothetical protein